MQTSASTNTQLEHGRPLINNLIESLPVEILPQILLNLDCFSLRSLLLAFPQVSQNCVLLVECHGDPWYHEEPCFFLDCAGLATMPMECCTPASISKYMFKIYALDSFCTYKDNSRVSLAEIHQRLPFFNKQSSVVVYFPSGDLYLAGPGELPAMHHLTAALQKKGVAFHFGPPKQPETRPASLSELAQITERLNLEEYPAPEGTFDKLTGIRFEGLESIDGINFSPHLKSLTVIFNNNHQKPSIRNVNLSGSLLLKFFIYYDDKVPFIENITFTDDENAFGHGVGNLLLLGHLPSLPGHLTAALPTHPDEGRDFGYLSVLLPHVKMFDAVMVIGGPTGVMEQLAKVSATASLEWKQTCQPLSEDHQMVINAETLITFKFETLLEKPRFPVLEYDRDRHDINCITATSYHGLNIDTLVELPRYLTELSLNIGTKSINDHVPTITDIWQSLVECSTDRDDLTLPLYKINIVGMKASPEVTQAQIRNLSASMSFTEALDRNEMDLVP